MAPSQNLGPVTHTFTPDRSNVLAGFVVSLLIYAGGAWLAFFIESETPSAARFNAWVAATAAVAGTGCLGYTLSLARRRIDLCEHGFHYRFALSAGDVSWSDVAHIYYHVIEDRADADRVTISTKAGETFRFTVNSVGDIAAFRAALQGRSFAAATSPASANAGAGYVRWRLFAEKAHQRWWLSALLAALFTGIGVVVFVDFARTDRGEVFPQSGYNFVFLMLHHIGGKWLAAGLPFAVGGYFTWKAVNRRLRSVPPSAGVSRPTTGPPPEGRPSHLQTVRDTPRGSSP